MATEQTSTNPEFATGRTASAICADAGLDWTGVTFFPSIPPVSDLPTSGVFAIVSAELAYVKGTEVVYVNPKDIPVPVTTTPQPITDPVWSSASSEGTWPSAGTTNGCRVNADEWSPVAGGSQTTFANSYHDWGATVICPSRTTGAVMTYPDVEICVPGALATAPEQPLSDLTGCTATWSHGFPAPIGSTPETNYQSEAAFDIFINPPAPGSGIKEVMVWTDLHTRQYLYLDNVFSGVTMGGTKYSGYATGKKTATHWYLALVRVDDTGKPIWSTTGTVDLHAVFQGLIAEGWLTADTLLGFIQYGFEVTTTRTKPLTFRVYDFSYTLAGITPVDSVISSRPSQMRRALRALLPRL